jgi:nitric oxide synthase oxygenase domain/subunit
MQKVETITPAFIDTLRVELQIAIDGVVSKYGLTAPLGNARYDDKMVRFSGFEVRADGVSKREQQYADMMGWPAIGEEFDMQGKRFVVSGYNPKKRNMPIAIISRADGKQYFTSADAANRNIALLKSKTS